MWAPPCRPPPAARYTGYVKGLQEVYGKTPVMAQVECQQPGQGSFIYTRTMSPPKSAPSRDPCNYAGAQLAAGARE